MDCFLLGVKLCFANTDVSVRARLTGFRVRGPQHYRPLPPLVIHINTQGSIIFMPKSMLKGPGKTRPHFAGAVHTCSKRNSYPTDLSLQMLSERQNAQFSDEKRRCLMQCCSWDKKDAQALDLWGCKSFMWSPTESLWKLWASSPDNSHPSLVHFFLHQFFI